MGRTRRSSAFRNTLEFRGGSVNELAIQQSIDRGLRELALFAGAGGGILGGKLLGWRTVCAVERDAYAASVLAQRQNDGHIDLFPIWSDIETFDGRPWRGIVDVVSGGFPCQAWSNAARGRNNGADMWPQMLRVVGEVEPKIIFAENVDEGAILMAQADLAMCGYKTNRCKISAMPADELHSQGDRT